MSNRQSHYIHLDLIFLMILFIAVSLFSIHNAQQLTSETYVLKQVIWFGIGIGFIAFIQLFDLDHLYKVSGIAFAVSVISLIVLRFSTENIAETIKGAKSWFTFKELGFGFSLQPSEFTKIAFILFLAALISHHRRKHKNRTMKTDFLLLLKIGVITVIPAYLTFLQPDLGTALVFAFIAGVLILLSGIDWKVLIVLIGATIVASLAFLTIIINFPDISEEVLGVKPHQVNRVLTWFDPSEETGYDTYQIDRSRLALGSGQLTGKGMNSLQVRLPEAHTDFIFSIIGESFGFIGGATVLLLYFLLLYRLVSIGLKIYEISDFGAYISFGFMSLILFHTFQNIGMTIGIMPITGIPLLLISYGGSSILSTMIGLGLVYRVAVEHAIQSDYLFK